MLSVVIIARDEARHLAGALASVRGLADDVLLLLDSRTRDESAAIGRAAGARVLIEEWRGFPAQRNRALDLCEREWVLFIDGDERVTPELHAELRALLDPSAAPPDLSEVAGFWIPRYNQFFGATLRGGGWYPDHQLRLLRRQRARYAEERQVHEIVRLDGAERYLSGHLQHLNIEHLGELWRKQTSYALQEGQTLYRAGRRARWRNFVGAPAREFLRRYITLGGYRDGALGLFLCATLAYFELIKFAHLKGLERLCSN